MKYEQMDYLKLGRFVTDPCEPVQVQVSLERLDLARLECVLGKHLQARDAQEESERLSWQVGAHTYV